MMSSHEPAIVIEDVKKNFKIPLDKSSGIKDHIVNFYKHRKGYREFMALNGVSFEVKRGEFLGIVGRNGSGKSTLLKILAGIYAPDFGTVRVNGSLTPFIELGVGFNPELSGRENVYLNGALLGFGRKEMEDMYDEIVSFAELHDFMEERLKNYSSGMQVRLAFSIAIQARSDILLLDEVLAVGDANFQRKCFDYFRQLKKQEQTVIFISHDMNAVREYCDRAILIDGGKIVQSGSPEKVSQEYTKLFLRGKAGAKEPDADDKKWGEGGASIHGVSVEVLQEKISISAEYVFSQATEHPIFGISIYNPMGTKVYESNTLWKGVETRVYRKGEKETVRWNIDNIFTNGTHSTSITAAADNGRRILEWWDDATSFVIEKDEVTTALSLPGSVVRVGGV